MYEILPHTADVVIHAAGANMAELLRSLLRGMFAAAEPRGTGGGTVERPFSVVSHDQTALVVDFLSEALASSDIRKEAYADVRFSSVTDSSAEGVFIGEPISGFGTQIKAATYHGLAVRRRPEDEMVEASVTFDV